MSVQEGHMKRSEARGTILAGGIALVGGALAFLGVFWYLAARFHYPEVLDGSAQDVLPALLATGPAGRLERQGVDHAQGRTAHLGARFVEARDVASGREELRQILRP